MHHVGTVQQTAMHVQVARLYALIVQIRTIYTNQHVIKLALMPFLPRVVNAKVHLFWVII